MAAASVVADFVNLAHLFAVAAVMAVAVMAVGAMEVEVTVVVMGAAMAVVAGLAFPSACRFYVLVGAAGLAF